MKEYLLLREHMIILLSTLAVFACIPMGLCQDNGDSLHVEFLTGLGGCADKNIHSEDHWEIVEIHSVTSCSHIEASCSRCIDFSNGSFLKEKSEFTKNIKLERVQFKIDPINTRFESSFLHQVWHVPERQSVAYSTKHFQDTILFLS